MRLADKMRSNSQEKKGKAQLQQANRMIVAQGKEIEKQGGGPGAVVISLVCVVPYPYCK